MAWRIEEADLRDLVGADADISVAPYIVTANRLADYVNDHDDVGLLNSNMLREIELYLAAHFYSHRDQRFKSNKTLDASADYQGRWGMGLESTDWGQDAMLLDVSGTLNALNKGGAPSIVWLGRPPSEQTDYVDRD